MSQSSTTQICGTLRSSPPEIHAEVAHARGCRRRIAESTEARAGSDPGSGHLRCRNQYGAWGDLQPQSERHPGGNTRTEKRFKSAVNVSIAAFGKHY